MDFSRKGIEKKRKDLKSVTKRLGSKFWITVLRMAIISVVAVGIICVMAGFGAFRGMIDTAPDVELTALEVKGYTSTSYYSDGTIAQIFYGQESNRVYVTIDQIPEVVQKCFVALEDRRFYDHKGVDFRTIFRAGYSFATSGFTQGASTLTQQLLKNQIFEGGREKSAIDKVVRKVQEQYLAIKLENVMSKDSILEYYVNLINLGNGCYGIETAAEGYFDKTVSELTLSEAAVLAPIALSPTRQNPLLYPKVNAERRKACLDAMLELGWCTKAEYDEALADDVYTRIAEIAGNKTSLSMGTYSYFTDSMLTELYKDLEGLGMTNEEARNLVFHGGIQIYTTQDREVQSIMDEYYTNEDNFPAFGFGSSQGSCYELTNDFAITIHHEDGTMTNYNRGNFLSYFSDYYDADGLYYHKNGGKNGISELFLSRDDLDAKIEEFVEAKMVDTDVYVDKNIVVNPQPQCAMTIIEQSTGKIVGIYGGRGRKTVNRGLNRAYGSPRQVGSTFKVLASFLPALDAGGLTLASVQDDSPFFYPGTQKEVYNWYSTGFRGLQSIRSGISNSLNIVAVKTLQQIGAPLGFEYLQKLGFSTLVSSQVDENGYTYSDINLSIALGGLTNGVSNVEVTAAYAAIANGGVYNKPIFYTKVLDHEGNVLIDKSPEPTQIMKTSTAWLLTDAMHDTTTVGTGTRLAFRNYNMPVAGKTGTASKNYDLWFAGYTPYYTAAVWTGYDHQFNQKNKSYQQDLWRNIMEEVHRSKALEYKTWEKPDSIVEAAICTKCGKLAVTGLCDEAEGGSCIKTEYFAKGTVPTQKCTCHVRVTICKSSKKLATDSCPAKKTKSVVLLAKNEDYSKYDGFPGYGGGCHVSTWDTAYVYNPEDVCDKHKAGGKDEPADDGGDINATDEDIFGEAHQMGAEDDVYSD